MAAKSRAQDAHKQASPISLDEYLMQKKRAGCAICRLPLEARAEIKKAREKRERQADIIEWLQVAYKAKIVPADFTSHVSGRHET